MLFPVPLRMMVPMILLICIVGHIPYMFHYRFSEGLIKVLCRFGRNLGKVFYDTYFKVFSGSKILIFYIEYLFPKLPPGLLKYCYAVGYTDL